MNRRNFFKFLAKGAAIVGAAGVLGLPEIDAKEWKSSDKVISLEEYANHIDVNIPGYTVDWKDSIFNRIKVKYNKIDNSVYPPLPGLTTETEWADDLWSQHMYGIREKVITVTFVTDKQAIAIRNEYLNFYSRPMVSPSIFWSRIVGKSLIDEITNRIDE